MNAWRTKEGVNTSVPTAVAHIPAAAYKDTLWRLMASAAQVLNE